jgi:hypothetical protein
MDEGNGSLMNSTPFVPVTQIQAIVLEGVPEDVMFHLATGLPTEHITDTETDVGDMPDLVPASESEDSDSEGEEALPRGHLHHEIDHQYGSLLQHEIDRYNGCRRAYNRCRRASDVHPIARIFHDDTAIVRMPKLIFLDPPYMSIDTPLTKGSSRSML